MICPTPAVLDWWRDWLPLHAMLSVANTHDSRLFEPLL
jgi:hypothetical protein